MFRNVFYSFMKNINSRRSGGRRNGSKQYGSRRNWKETNWKLIFTNALAIKTWSDVTNSKFTQLEYYSV